MAPKAQVEDISTGGNTVGNLPTIAAVATTNTALATLVPTHSAIPASPSPAPALAGQGQPAKDTGPACDQVAPGIPIDVTVPDGTQFRPGESFSKTWRLVNSGSCTWTPEYSIVWFSGQPIGVVPQQPISNLVLPGQSLDLTVDMLAPEQPGRFQSNWKLRNAKGQMFGIGPNGDAPFWVQIEVVEDSTVTPAPEPTIQPTLAVYASGSANLVPGDGFDLDRGVMNPVDSIDFNYQIPGPEGQPQLIPAKGIRLALFGSTEPKEDDCRLPVQTSAPLVLTGVENGVDVCYRTGQGLPGFAHFIKPSEKDALVSMDFLTWTVP